MSGETIQAVTLERPYCKGTMQLVRHLDLRELPDIFVYYCSRCQHVETVMQERAA
jgi:hypothetical protein